MGNRSASVNGLLYVLLLIVLGVFLFATLRHGRESSQSLSIGQVAQRVRSGEVKGIIVSDQELTVEMVDGRKFQSRKEDGASVVETLRNLSVSQDTLIGGLDQISIATQAPSEWSKLAPILGSLLPILLIGAFFFFILRQAQGGNAKALEMGKSRVTIVRANEGMPTFQDVAGVSEAKAALQEMIAFLSQPDKWHDFGAQIPKGCLLVGPPGCGKTLLARAVAGEAGVPFFTISGADFVEMFVGVGASRVRSLFEECKQAAPCVLFIDELDALGRARRSDGNLGDAEREQTLNQLLVAMDGFEANPGVVILAATNRPDMLDRALMRPGRFDRKIRIDLPNAQERGEILKIHLRDRPLASDVDLGIIARLTPGYSGADLANLSNEAALQAVRRFVTSRGLKKITEKDFDQAFGVVQSGREVSSSLDLVIIESATHYAEPTDELFVRMFIGERQAVEGQLIWADPSHIKFRSAADNRETILPKNQIWKFEMLGNA